MSDTTELLIRLHGQNSALEARCAEQKERIAFLEALVKKLADYPPLTLSPPPSVLSPEKDSVPRGTNQTAP